MAIDGKTATAGDFAATASGVLHKLRGALTDLLTSAGADPSRPQDVARQFGLNKNMTWRASKIVNATDVFAAVEHIPGPAGAEILIRALVRHGASPVAAASLRAALAEFDRLVHLYAGDRARLELMVSSLSTSSRSRERLERERRVAFQGNAATWGVQAEAQMSLQILAPNQENPDLVDVVTVGGLHNFWRLRPDVQWVFFRQEAWNDGNEPGPPPNPRGEAIDPRLDRPGALPLLEEFCSTPAPELTLTETIGPQMGEAEYELPEGPVGTLAAITCVYGTISRQAGPAYACDDDDDDDAHCEVGCTLLTPVEFVQSDLLVHESLTWALDPEVAIYGRVPGGPMLAGAPERRRLPIAGDLVTLGHSPAAVATPHLPGYSRIVRTVLERVGWSAEQFHGFRFTVPYPPIPATALFRCPLPRR